MGIKMRAARLLRMLLILQNRGRQTTQQLANDLEVATRTILRDVDALEEAGLPIIVHRGPQGGIELGFDYRTRLTGLTSDEAEAVADMLSYPTPLVSALGIQESADRAREKLIESFPDPVRNTVTVTQRRFRFVTSDIDQHDERVQALAHAIRESKVVRIDVRSSKPRTIHPIALVHDSLGWSVVDARDETNPIELSSYSDINISSHRFNSNSQ
ncbi:MAG: HTH domain-containing protein [Gammaproteobacteria bacterium]|nr:HTH domain-containing protein [Gammaproteobacteria bacterium]